jgi:hypothetical protein
MAILSELGKLQAQLQRRWLQQGYEQFSEGIGWQVPDRFTKKSLAAYENPCGLPPEL